MANVADNAIKVQGLKEFLTSLQRLQVEAPRIVVKEALNAAAELVVTDARRRSPVRTGHLRESIVATSTVNFARVSEGNSHVPYAGFIDYGGTVGRYRNTEVHYRARQARTARFFAVRPFIRTGRILYPAFQAQRNAVLVQMDTVLREAVAHVGLKVDA